jgi:hypothetical protein
VNHAETSTTEIFLKPLAEVCHISVQRVLPLYPIHVPYSFFFAMTLGEPCRSAYCVEMMYT